MKTATFWRRLFRGAWRGATTTVWEQCVARTDFDLVMTMPVTDRHHAKQGRSTGRVIWKGDHGEVRFYLKRHHQLPRWRGWLATFWPHGNWSPAAREAQQLAWARSGGLAVPRTLAWAERVGPGGRLQSFLALEELTGFEAVNELLPRARHELGDDFEQWKRALAKQLANVVARLHVARHYHKDLYLCHFFVKLRGQHVHLIDLHRLARHSWTGWRWRVKDLAQLSFSADLPEISTRDRLRFFHAYLGQRKLDARSRRLLRAVERKADRYRARHVRKLANQCAGAHASTLLAYAPPQPTPSRRAS